MDVTISSERRTKGGANMGFDYRKLKGKIKEKFDTQDNFAKALGISRTSLSFKLNNRVDFTQSEMTKSYELLDVKRQEIAEYFFNLKVQKSELKSVS